MVILAGTHEVVSVVSGFGISNTYFNESVAW